jgi:hypothetical protein
LPVQTLFLFAVRLFAVRLGIDSLFVVRSGIVLPVFGGVWILNTRKKNILM